MSRMRRLIALLVLVVYGTCLALPSALASPERLTYQDFREIPGVTDREIVSIEMLRTLYKSFTYGMLDSTETFKRADGTYGGYSALFCAWMSQLFGFEFTPRTYTWDELIEGLENGEIDFTGEITATPETRAQYHMSDTFTERTVKAFRLRGGKSLNELGNTRTVRYGFLTQSPAIEQIRQNSGYDVHVTELDSVQQAIPLLRTAGIDAFIGDEHIASVFPSDIVAEDVFPVLYAPTPLTTANNLLAPIISVFDKYLQNGGMYELTAMYNRGNHDYQEFKLLSDLTDKERAYLDAHIKSGEPIRVLAEFDTYPSSFYNVQEGAWQGIAFDVLNSITALSGLRFEVVNRPDEEWASLVERLEEGDAAMVTEFIYSQAREDDFLWSQEPYAEDYYALLSLVEHEDITINQVLYLRIGLVQDSAYADVFREWFPDHLNVTDYATTDEGFAALENEEIDLLMASRNLLLSATNFHENPGFKANLVFDRTFAATFGFNKDEYVLRSLIDKAQRLIDTKTIAERWERKVYDYRGKLAREQVPYLIGVVTLLILVLVLLSVLIARNRQMNKRLESTVRERTAELVVASQAKSDFLSRMSHEIRTPLNAIMGMAQIAKQSAMRESPATVQSIDQMMTASTHLLGILNDVLDMSKIEAGKFVLASEAFMMLEAMRDVESIIAQRCGEKNINFVVDIDERARAWVLGDKLRLKQVLINLLGNAVKFTDAGGRIDLDVGLVSDEPDALRFAFTVTDNGIGMSPEQLSRLFVAFEQADSSIASRFGGTGLGLAISQNLVGLMGGTIEVSSVQGEGSTFTFALSFDKAQAPKAAAQARPVDDLDLTGKRILLAEDIEINRLIIRELLKETNVAIDEAEDGQRAIDVFAQSPEGYYDLIFMDIMMPNVNGYDAARAIRALGREDAQAVPIIAMTANAYREDIEKALAAGMNGHVAKPIDIDDVLKLLAEKLGDNQGA